MEPPLIDWPRADIAPANDGAVTLEVRHRLPGRAARHLDSALSSWLSTRGAEWHGEVRAALPEAGQVFPGYLRITSPTLLTSDPGLIRGMCNRFAEQSFNAGASEQDEYDEQVRYFLARLKGDPI